MDTNNKTVEELNEMLYEKMEFEQTEYKQPLMDMKTEVFPLCSHNLSTSLL